MDNGKISAPSPAPQRKENSPAVKSKLERLSGSKSRDFSELLLGQALAACQGISRDLNTADAMTDALVQLEPKDPLEAALVSQSLSVHFQAMQLLAKAGKTDLPEVREQWLKLASKLMSLYSRQVESLTKYQRKGRQNITIKHVHLEPGANAVLGSVTHTKRGGA